jgi:Ca2+-binding RTX toxin-like protein
MFNPIRSYSPYLAHPKGSTGSGLDQVIEWLAADPGLLGAGDASVVRDGIAAADALNAMLVQGLMATGSASHASLSTTDLIALNGWIRSDAGRLSQWQEQRRIVLNLVAYGGNRQFRSLNLIGTVLNGVYALGSPLDGSGQLQPIDGTAPTSIADVATWLTVLRSDLATSGLGLDRLVEQVEANAGLAANLPWTQISEGAQAANGLNQLIAAGLAALPAGVGNDPRHIETAEVLWINQWIRSNPSRLAQFLSLHGDDANGVETGFHKIQADGGTIDVFGVNLVDTVMDGIYHIGFNVNADQRFLNEDGNANALVSDVAEWLTYYVSDASSTGTGLDLIIDLAKLDAGLSSWTSATEINAGLAAANDINALIVDAVTATGVNLDGWISRSDLRKVNSWIATNRASIYTTLHGDDEADGTATGFHKIQGNGTISQILGNNLIDTVADGIYHLGFAIINDYFVNEDGNANASLSDVSSWINYFLNGRRIIDGSWNNDVILGSEAAEQVVAYGGEDWIETFAGNDLLDGNWGADSLFGGAGMDILDGSWGDDWLDGGEDGDTYLVSGCLSGNGLTFQDYDTYLDSGLHGVDRIVANGPGDVDIGLHGFLNTGIDVIDANGTTGSVRLLGWWDNEVFDFSSTTLIGSNLRIDGHYGDDVIYGSATGDTITGGGGNDWLDGGEGADSYQVSGTEDGGWELFSGFDSYWDSGSSGSDGIIAIGTGNVDIGVAGFGPENGIEKIDTRGTTGIVRLLDSRDNNILDLSSCTVLGTNLRLDGNYGNDTMIGGSGADTITGGGDDDWLNGGNGADTYLVSGTAAGGWGVFTYFDTYADSGSAGVDRILAVGPGDVDIGLRSFSATNGIEQIDATGTTGIVRLLGDWSTDLLDFTKATLIGSNLRIDGNYGADTITGSGGADTITGGGGDDWLNGGHGGDSYLVSGTAAGGWELFSGYDTYADSGNTGVDRLLAVGPGDVDIGLRSFSATNGIEQIDATGSTGLVRLLGDWSSDLLDFSKATLLGANLRLEGNHGADTIIGSAGTDTITGGGEEDRLNGGNGGDTYLVSGNAAGGWELFSSFDTYADSGTTGVDRLLAVGPGDVDIGLRSFTATNGIEQIDATGTTGLVRLLGDWSSDLLDFSKATLLGTNLRIDGSQGADTIIGSAGTDTITGGGEEDRLNGGNGGDTYLVSGNAAGHWELFSAFDTYADNGTTGVDRILAVGPGDVDIGLRNFTATNGIEQIDATGTTGLVRLLADWSSDLLDFSKATLIGSNLRIDGNYGNDTITGSGGADTIIGGGGDDRLNGGNGGDTYLVSGTYASGWYLFSGVDTFIDNGTTGVDRILAVGPGDVEINLGKFGAANGIEQIDATGTTGVVSLLGNWLANTLDFSKTTLLGGNLLIDALEGNDTITGSTSNDVINAGSGTDRVIGSLGADRMTGGSERDTYVYSQVNQIGLGMGNRDSITDFTSGQDFLDLNAIDSNTVLAGNQNFRYIAGLAFSGVAGELRLENELLSGDINGDRKADFELNLVGVTSLVVTTDLRL